MRKSGVLLHISSLPGDYSIGSFGREAYRFVDFLAESGFSYWQVLPFCMPDECNSPYKSHSSFGANPYFIDLELLWQEGLITREELDSARGNGPYLAEYERLKKERIPLLMKAAERCDRKMREEIDTFMKENPELYEASLFFSYRKANLNEHWRNWNVEICEKKVLFGWEFIQYKFFTQWQKVKKYANSKGIEIIGDIPIYVAFDSADVWSDTEQFLLDGADLPTSVAGVPPDYFSLDGQLWENPLYNWKQMKKDGFGWWKRRIEYMLTLFDGVRIDHFRAFESYWSVPFGAKSAKEGKWVKGPGRAIINAIKEVAKDKLIIAEDLGHITPAVHSLLKYSRMPGMRVVQFAFLGDENSIHLPHNFDKNCVAYTGTHDNNTLLGYIYELDAENRKRLFDYFGFSGESFTDAVRHIVRALLASTADTVIIPIQDLLVYGCDTRMNTPGVANGNWAYRVTREQLSEIDRESMRYYNKLYGR